MKTRKKQISKREETLLRQLTLGNHLNRTVNSRTFFHKDPSNKKIK